MKRYMIALMTLALLLASISTTAYAQTKKSAATKKTQKAHTVVKYDQPTTRQYFSWKHYGVNPLAPDAYIAAPAGVDTTDKSQVYDIIAGSKGYERATKAVRAGMAASLFGDPSYTMSDKFWSELQTAAAAGLEETCIDNGQRAGDFPLTFGSKLDAKGNTLSYAEGPYPVNETGGTICGWKFQKQVQLDGGPHAGEWVRPIIYKQCRNTSAFKAEPYVAPAPKPLESAPVTTAPAPAPVPAPTTEPAPVVKPVRVYHERGSRMLFEAGIAFRIGSVNSSYSGAVQPGTGDASQHNRFTALLPVFRVEPTEGSGLFAVGQFSVLDKTGPKFFEDPVKKIRDTDSTKDQRYEALAGWQFGVHGVGIAPFAGYESFCLCETYTAQGANTTTQRAYKQFVFGAQGKFTGRRATLRVRGNWGHGTRTQWTHQTFGSVDFPRVDQPKATASSFEVRPEIDVHVVGPLHAIATFDFTHYMSRRTNTFAANESVNVSTLTFGVTVGFGR